MKIIQKIIGLYFFIGAIITYLFYLLTQSTDHIFSFLIPTTIATLVFLIYTLLSYLYLKYPNRTVYENGFSIMLLIQSLNIELFGYGFKNFYFPEVAIHFNLKELSEHALQYGCEHVSPQTIKTLLNFWAIKKWIKRNNPDFSRNHTNIVL